MIWNVMKWWVENFWKNIFFYYVGVCHTSPKLNFSQNTYIFPFIDFSTTFFFQYKVYKFFENDPFFHKRNFENLDEFRRITTLRIYKMLKAKLLTDEEMLINPHLVSKYFSFHCFRIANCSKVDRHFMCTLLLNVELWLEPVKPKSFEKWFLSIC